MVMVYHSMVASCTLCACPVALYTPLKDEESARDNHVLAGNIAKYSPIIKISLKDSATNLS